MQFAPSVYLAAGFLVAAVAVSPWFVAAYFVYVLLAATVLR